MIHKQNKIMLVLIILFIFLLPQIYASYAVSSPRSVNMQYGESKEFYFQIQAYQSKSDLECKIELEDTNPFEISFANKIYIVKKQSAGVVKGIVQSNKKPKEPEYLFNFCISCILLDKPGGSTTAVKYCDIPIKINVISDTIKLSRLEKSHPLFLAIALIAVCLICIVFWMLIWKKKKKK